MYPDRGQEIPNSESHQSFQSQNQQSGHFPQRRSRNQWNYSPYAQRRQLLIAAVIITICFTLFQNNSLKSQIERLSDETRMMNQTLTQLKQDMFQLDFRSYKGNHHVDVLNEQVRTAIAEVEDTGKVQMSHIQQQIIRCIRELIKVKGLSKEKKQIPSILWFYTQHQYAGSKMIEQLLGSTVLKMAKLGNLQIRFVNSLDCYDWLSKGTIRKIFSTMQTMKIQTEVNDLLRLALLMEYGGILIRIDKVFLTSNLNWVFNTTKDVLRHEVILFSEQYSKNSLPFYQDYFIAAVSQASLIVDIFNLMCETVSSGKVQFKQLKEAVRFNPNTNSTYIQNFTLNMFRALLESMTPSFYAVKVINLYLQKRKSQLCENNFYDAMRKSKQGYAKQCGKPVHFISGFDRNQLQDQIQKTFDKSKQELRNIDPDSYWYKLLSLDDTITTFLPQPSRKVQYCIIDPEPSLDVNLIKASITKLKEQTYKNWLAVYFVNKETETLKQLVKEENQVKQKIRFGIDDDSVGKNLQKGIIKYCPLKSFVIILKSKEYFQSKDALVIMSQELGQRGVLGAFMGVKIKEKLTIPEYAYQDYHKNNYNGLSPNYNDLSTIQNLFRVFHSDCYKIIPQFQLKTPIGTYFNSRFVFLEQFLLMVRQDSFKNKQRVEWMKRTSSNIFDIPNRIVVMKQVVIESEVWEEVNKKQLEINKFKSGSFTMKQHLEKLLQNGQTMQQFAIFNPAIDFDPEVMDKRPAAIPKVIHQFWLQGQMPNSTLALIQMNKKLYPDFTFKMWTKDNITLPRFPRNYDLIQNLLSTNKITRHSKMNMLIDVLVPQLLYSQGGFYLDLNVLLLKDVLKNWLSYGLVVVAEPSLSHRWAQGLSFIGVVPKYSAFLRIIQYNNTNRYNIFNPQTNLVTGKQNLQQLIKDLEEYRNDILFLPYETFHPKSPTLHDPSDSYCLSHPRLIKNKSDIMLYYQGRALDGNCKKYYPYAFGVQIEGIGMN